MMHSCPLETSEKWPFANVGFNESEKFLIMCRTTRLQATSSYNDTLLVLNSSIKTNGESK